MTWHIDLLLPTCICQRRRLGPGMRKQAKQKNQREDLSRVWKCLQTNKIKSRIWRHPKKWDILNTVHIGSFQFQPWKTCTCWWSSLINFVQNFTWLLLRCKLHENEKIEYKRKLNFLKTTNYKLKTSQHCKIWMIEMYYKWD